MYKKWMMREQDTRGTQGPAWDFENPFSLPSLGSMQQKALSYSKIGSMGRNPFLIFPNDWLQKHLLKINGKKKKKEGKESVLEKIFMELREL